MQLRTALRLAGAIAGTGAVAGTTAFLLAGSPASYTPAAARLSTVATSSTSSTTTTAPTCDDGPWILDGNRNVVQGRPDHLDAGDRGTTYVWHDADGWHLRATDPKGQKADYSGTIVVSSGARVTGLHTVKLEQDDSVTIDGNNVIHYSFDTYHGLDGIDFHVSACGGDRAQEALSFHLSRNGSDDDRARIALGDTGAHPDSSSFRTVRRV